MEIFFLDNVGLIENTPQQWLVNIGKKGFELVVTAIVSTLLNYAAHVTLNYTWWIIKQPWVWLYQKPSDTAGTTDLQNVIIDQTIITNEQQTAQIITLLEQQRISFEMIENRLNEVDSELQSRAETVQTLRQRLDQVTQEGASQDVTVENQLLQDGVSCNLSDALGI